MKFMVEVNAKYLVSVEADSALGAEHYILDTFRGTWGANAFDREALATDTFAGAVAFDEVISLKELKELNDTAIATQAAAKEAEKAVDAAEAEIDRLTQLLEEAKAAKAMKVREQINAQTAASIASKAIGEQRR